MWNQLIFEQQKTTTSSASHQKFKICQKTLNLWRLFVTPVFGLPIKEVVHCDPLTSLFKGVPIILWVSKILVLSNMTKSKNWHLWKFRKLFKRENFFFFQIKRVRCVSKKQAATWLGFDPFRGLSLAPTKIPSCDGGGPTN